MSPLMRQPHIAIWVVRRLTALSHVSVKANFSALLEDSLRPLGYRSGGSGVFRKDGANFDYQVFLSFTGKVAIECRVYFGFRIDEIDQRLNSIPVIKQQMASGSRNLVTISSPLDVVARATGAEVDYSINLEKDWTAPVERLVNAIGAAERGFESLDDIASFAFRETSLALGHHAFRIPLLLRMTARNEEYEAYVDRVRATGFIPNYDSFLDEISNFRA